MHLRRELIKISQSVLDEASSDNDVNNSGELIIQNAEKSLLFVDFQHFEDVHEILKISSWRSGTRNH